MYGDGFSERSARYSAERRVVIALLEALADLHLHHVAGGDVFLGRSTAAR